MWTENWCVCPLQFQSSVLFYAFRDLLPTMSFMHHSFYLLTHVTFYSQLTINYQKSLDVKIILQKRRHETLVLNAKCVSNSHNSIAAWYINVFRTFKTHSTNDSTKSVQTHWFWHAQPFFHLFNSIIGIFFIYSFIHWSMCMCFFIEINSKRWFDGIYW